MHINFFVQTHKIIDQVVNGDASNEKDFLPQSLSRTYV